jgi:4-phosphopantoate--beta-alanine ligase
MSEKKDRTKEVPKDHPRAQSLYERHKIINGMKKLVVAEAGLIAHGRGEAFDYLIGEKTNNNAESSMEAAVAAMMTAKHPIISVNGNIAALCSDDLVKLSKLLDIPLEINLFYGKPGRIEAISDTLKKSGATNILGVDPNQQSTISELSSNRRNVDAFGIKKADVVLVPLEDGDRTEALIKENRFVIAIDLNPLSRTSQWANITIVDNVIRAIPKMIEIALKFKNQLKENKITRKKLESTVETFNNKRNLSNAIKIIVKYLNSLAKKGVFIPI